jgi:hypothetical protein
MHDARGVFAGLSRNRNPRGTGWGQPSETLALCCGAMRP